jgi:hypothetical protein
METAPPANYPIGLRKFKEREAVGCDRRDEQIPVQKLVPHSQLVSAIRGIDVDYQHLYDLRNPAARASSSEQNQRFDFFVLT